ncbi:insulin-like growth factor 2 mRNA-binding protein 2 isoform X2 [Dysidea avara]|uniref:insulin-like growth factor 2 mRNA-binding protein 2 isoform X2 n=1 Tax=Dysidea avara TaxID=196820 RepID=UPI00331D1D1B
MTQLYIGNLSAEADEKTVRAVFGKYGVIRDTVMKNGYAFLAFDNPMSADAAVKEMNGTDLLGSHIIVELSHQQRTGRKKNMCGRVEVTNIPDYMNWQAVETLLGSVGTVIKSIPEDSDFCPPTKGIVVFETIEQAQRAANTFTGDEHSPKVTFIEEVRRPSSAAASLRSNGNRVPMSPTSNNGPMSPIRSTSDFPLRILVPNEMVGAIIGKEGLTIRNITQITKARVDVHRKENTNSNEKAITIIGPPECCTEASHLIMKIMQRELLITSGLLEGGQILPDPLPCVPLKLLAHNELIGRVIGKQGATLKRIMAESNTKITISKIKDLTPYNMERTITVLGTVDNCKKAESLISTKLRTSFESDMAHLIPTAQQQQPQPNGGQQLTNGSPPFSSPSPDTPPSSHPSIPTSPTSPFHSSNFYYNNNKVEFVSAAQNSCGALEVNGLTGFSQQLGKPNDNPSSNVNGLYDFPDPFETVLPNNSDPTSDLMNGLPDMMSSLELESNRKTSLPSLGGSIWADNSLFSPVLGNSNGSNNVSYGWGPPGEKVTSPQPWSDGHMMKSTGFQDTADAMTSLGNYLPNDTSNFFSETRVVNTSYPFSPVSINSPTIPTDSNPMISKPKLTGTPQKAITGDLFTPEFQWRNNVFTFDDQFLYGTDHALQTAPL